MMYSENKLDKIESNGYFGASENTEPRKLLSDIGF